MALEARGGACYTGYKAKGGTGTVVLKREFWVTAAKSLLFGAVPLVWFPLLYLGFTRDWDYTYLLVLLSWIYVAFVHPAYLSVIHFEAVQKGWEPLHKALPMMVSAMLCCCAATFMPMLLIPGYRENSYDSVGEVLVFMVMRASAVVTVGGWLVIAANVLVKKIKAGRGG